MHTGWICQYLDEEEGWASLRSTATYGLWLMAEMGY
jgi:hypothetical protein